MRSGGPAEGGGNDAVVGCEREEWRSEETREEIVSDAGEFSLYRTREGRR